MKRTTFIIALLISIIVFSGESSALGNKIMLKGSILNKSDNTPLNTEITFKSPNGKEIQTKSNDGKYEILLDANVKYDLFINSENTIRFQTEFLYNSNSSYEEINKDYFVSKIEAGAIVTHIKNAFTENDLSSEALSELDEVKKILRFNRTVYLTFYLINDSVESASELKKQTLQSVIDSWKRYSNKIEKTEIVSGYKSIDASNGDIIVIISTIKDPFK